MKRIIALIIALVLVAAAFAACAKSDAPKEDDTQKTPDSAPEARAVDPEEAARAIVAGGDFEGPIDQIDPAAVEVIYANLPADAKGAVYMPGVTCADEVAVFTSEDVAAVEASVRAHVADQRAGFASYMPEQVPKIDAAIVYTSGNTVVLVISNDAAGALQLIKQTVG